MSTEALARALALSDGWQADVDGDTAWMSYLDPAERILADPAALLAALAEAGVLAEEWATQNGEGGPVITGWDNRRHTEQSARDEVDDFNRAGRGYVKYHPMRRYTTDWTEVSP